MPENDIVAALDIGTTKICVLIGDIDPHGQIRILGLGQSVSEGLRRGVIVDIPAASRNIVAAVEDAQRQTGVQISSVVVGVTGEHVRSTNIRGAATITHSNREIGEGDVQKVMENAQLETVPAGREILHVLPRGFAVDGQSGVRDPIGMSGCRLEVVTHVVTGATSFLQNVSKTVEGAGLGVDAMVLEPVAACESVLSPGDRELGVLLADIGGGTTDVAVVMDGAVAHSAVIPVGGNHVTNDLAYGLKVCRSEAERLKRKYGTTRTALVQEEEIVDLESVDDETVRQVTRQAIAEIIEPRMREIYCLIRQHLEDAGLLDYLTIIVLTGGGSLLHGAPELAGEILGLPCRIGRPRDAFSETVDVRSPIYSTAVGLLYYGASRRRVEREERSTGHFLTKAFQQLRLWLTHLFVG